MGKSDRVRQEWKGEWRYPSMGVVSVGSRLIKRSQPNRGFHGDLGEGPRPP